MTSVYIVTTGVYSGYRIHSLWSTRAKAEATHALLTRCGEDTNEVVEEEVDPILPTPPDDLLPYWVRFGEDGAITDIRVIGLCDEGITGRVDGVVMATVFARDENHAKAIAIERRTLYEAKIAFIADGIAREE